MQIGAKAGRKKFCVKTECNKTKLRIRMTEFCGNWCQSLHIPSRRATNSATCTTCTCGRKTCNSYSLRRQHTLFGLCRTWLRRRSGSLARQVRCDEMVEGRGGASGHLSCKIHEEFIFSQERCFIIKRACSWLVCYLRIDLEMFVFNYSFVIGLITVSCLTILATSPFWALFRKRLKKAFRGFVARCLLANSQKNDLFQLETLTEHKEWEGVKFETKMQSFVSFRSLLCWRCAFLS